MGNVMRDRAVTLGMRAPQSESLRLTMDWPPTLTNNRAYIFVTSALVPLTRQASGVAGAAQPAVPVVGFAPAPARAFDVLLLDAYDGIGWGRAGCPA